MSTYCSCQSHASRDEIVRRRLVRGQHAELGLVDEVDKILDLGLEVGLRDIGLLVGVGGLVASGCVGERHCVFGDGD
jgi:hypothetical protein